MAARGARHAPPALPGWTRAAWPATRCAVRRERSERWHGHRAVAQRLRRLVAQHARLGRRGSGSRVWRTGPCVSSHRRRRARARLASAHAATPSLLRGQLPRRQLRATRQLQRRTMAEASPSGGAPSSAGHHPKLSFAAAAHRVATVSNREKFERLKASREKAKAKLTLARAEIARRVPGRSCVRLRPLWRSGPARASGRCT